MSVVQVGLALIGTFFLLLALSASVSTGLIASSVLTTACVIDPDLTIFVASQKVIAGVDSFPLIAISFFILCGVLMNSGGVVQKLINFTKLLVGFIPDGFVHASILGSTLFGSISGSSVVASITVGGVMIPLEEKEGYNRKFAAVANTASVPTGLVIPPSGILIIYAVLLGCSVVGMIVNGHIPGSVRCIACMMVAFVATKKNRYPTTKAVPAKVFIHMFIDAVPGLLLVVIIVGGMCFGIFMTAESVAVAVACTLFLSIVCYRTVEIKDLPAILCDTCETTVVTMFLTTASFTMSFIMSFTGLPAAIGKATLNISSSPYVVLLMINTIFLIVSILMDITPAVLVFTSIFLPVVKSFGTYPTHFGIMMIMNLGIGNAIPPVGSALFLGYSVAGIDMEDMIRPILPLYGAILAALTLAAYVFWFSMAVPTLVGTV